MIRLVHLLRRRHGLTLAEFQTRWRDEHGPLMASHQTTLAIGRHVQSHRLDDSSSERAVTAMVEARGGEMEPPYDGVAESWWESETVYAAAMESRRGRQASNELLADEADFIDLAHSPLWFAYEYPQVSVSRGYVLARPKSGVVKSHFPLRHPATMDMAEAQHYWLNSHGPYIRSMAEARGVLRYQQVHRFESPLATALSEARGTIVEPYTGHAEGWTDRLVSRAGPELDAAAQGALRDERNFIDWRRSAIWLGKEHVFIDRW